MHQLLVHELSEATLTLALDVEEEEEEEALLLLAEAAPLLAPAEAAETTSGGCGASAADSTPGTGTAVRGMGYDVMPLKG